jgi:site-specific recombinase XerD
VKDKSYRAFPLGLEAGHYLRAKRKRLTTDSYRDYESCLDKLARHFADLELRDFEPPVGTERLEEFLDFQWGAKAGRTYNKNLSILRDFFKFQVLRSKLHGDPTLPIERATNRSVHRTIFSTDERNAILASNPALRDKIALRLLLDYGLRKGALQHVQFKHFDHHRKRLTIFTKGGKIRDLPIPQSGFWFDLERMILEEEAQPSEYLLPPGGGAALRVPTPASEGDPAQGADGDASLPREADGRPRATQLVVPLPAASGSRSDGHHLR